MADKEAAVNHYEIYFKELKNSSESGSPFDHESVRIFLILKLFICNHCESHIYHIVNRINDLNSDEFSCLESFGIPNEY